MRNLIGIFALTTIATMTSGCASSSTMSAQQSGAQSAHAGNSKPCVMQSAGRDVLRLSLPPDATCAPQDGSLHLGSHDRFFDIWLIRGSQTVTDALPRVSQEIQSEFKDFKATSTTTPTIGGTPAKRLLGSGVEADDNDPGTADVVVFKIGNNVFIACTHGEHLAPAAQEWMLEILQTAHTP